MTRMPSQRSSYTIAHELSKRLRIRTKRLMDPNLDHTYFQASLEAIDGVSEVRVNGPACSVVVEYSGEKSVRTLILSAISDIPKDAYMADVERENPPDKLEVGVRATLAAATPFLPVPVQAAMSWMLAAPGIVNGVETLLNDGVKIEVLDATVKTMSLMRGDYFTSNSVGALLSLGENIESESETKSTDLLKSLLKPQVETVWVERDGMEVEISYDDAIIGDIVICGPGEFIPVEGEVVEGEASINFSSITGESLPVHVGSGENVISGGVIEDGKIKIRAEQVGSGTGMARINRFLENSLRSKSKSQIQSAELADKLVPLTFGAGLGVYALTGDMARAASVLTVDYSCAIKLSTPIAVRTSMYSASQHGVLLKGAQALDNLASVDTLVFDKTGTLTKGILAVSDVFPLGELSAEELLALAAGAEEHYAHPVACAVVAEARKQGITLPETSGVDFIVAHGVSAYVGGSRIVAGSRHFIHDDEGIDCSGSDEVANALRKEGKSILYVAKDGELAGLIGMRDELREEANAILSGLKQSGIKKIIVLTGDHEVTAKAIASQLPSLDEIHWELKPEDKAAIVTRLKEAGAKIAFAGDGVNDAPALLSAHVGICMPSGADIAKETAQVVLLTEDLGALLEARRVAMATRKTLSNCLWSAVAINSATLLLAGMGTISTLQAALTHNLSTIGILGYAAWNSSEKGRSSEHSFSQAIEEDI